MNKNNINNSTTRQALLDLVKVCTMNGDDDALQHLNYALDHLGDDVYKSADLVFDGHKYPNRSLQFVKMPVSSDIQPIDMLDPDEVYFLTWIMRRVGGFTNYVAFKLADLVSLGIGGSQPWSERKLMRVVSKLRACNAISVVDSSQSRNYGTIYMISPYIYNAFGSERRTSSGINDFQFITGDKFSDDTDKNSDLPYCKFPVINYTVPSLGKPVQVTHIISSGGVIS